MTGAPSLPPPLEQFVREQVAAGRYPSEGDVVRAAVQLLAASAADAPEGVATAQTRRPGRAALTEVWEPVGTAASPPPRRRSPRGLLADLRSDITPDDISDIRADLWNGPRPGGAR